MKMQLRQLMILGGMGMAVGVSSMAVANDPIVYDNIPNGYNLNSFMSSQLDLNYPFDSQTADDFILKSDMLITGVNWVGGIFGGPPITPDAFNILIYADAGGVPTGGPNDPSGTALASYTLLPGDWDEVNVDGSNVEYSAKLPSSFAARGGTTYWLAVQFVFPFPGMWGISSATDSMQGSDNVIGFPLLNIPYWTDGAKVFGSPRDNAFQLTGVIPAPGALALLGIAGVAGRRRRRLS